MVTGDAFRGRDGLVGEEILGGSSLGGKEEMKKKNIVFHVLFKWSVKKTSRCPQRRGDDSYDCVSV